MSRDDDQLPSWDEFGAEQLDYGEDEEEVAAPTAEDGEDPGDPGEDGNVRVAPAAARAAAGSDGAAAAAAASRDIGPSLPPGFDLGRGAHGADDDEDEDPEDPGDPGELQPAVVDEAELAPTLPSLALVGPSLPIDEMESASSSSMRSSSSSMLAPSSHSASAASSAASLTSSRAAAAASLSTTSSSDPDEPGPRRLPMARCSRGRVPAPAPRGSRGRGGARPVIGPAIPADFLPSVANGEDDEEEEDDEYEDIDQREEDEEVEEEEGESFGPALPPGMNGNGGAAARPAASISPDMPMMEEEDDDDVIGPMPARSAAEEHAAEARRAQLRAEKEAEESKPKREEWMLSLPKKLNSYGLGPRSFSKSNGAGNDGGKAWTTGPGTSAASDPATSKESMEKLATAERDAMQARLASSLTAGRNESMLDAHSRKRKAGEEAVAGPSAPKERVPFNIETDMQVRGLKSASTEEIKEKCGHLSSRFGNSGSAKFL